MRAPARFVVLSAACLALSLSLAAQAPAVPLTVEKIYAHGPLIGTPPADVSWSPDGKHLTYLDSGQIVDIDPGSGKPHVMVSHAKIAAIQGAKASEQDRDHRSRYGMASYFWAPDSRHLLFDANGRLWLYDLSNGTGLEIGSSGQASGSDPKFSPDGQSISFVRENGLNVINLKIPGTPSIAVAPTSDANTTNGFVDWVYAEELGVRSNYFWSPDSKHLAFLQANESAVPQYPITDWIPTHAVASPQRYPNPGDPNPAVRIGVVGAAGGKAVWLKLPIVSGQDYIPRFGWADHRSVWVETLTRDHKHRSIWLADAATGESHRILDIADDKFLDDNYYVNVEAGSIVLSNWTDEHNHVYLYAFGPSGEAKLVKQLTSGNWDVSEIYRVDPAQKLVYYASNEGNPLELQIWQVGFDGTRKQLSSGAGYHQANFAPAGSAFSDRYSTRMQPPTVQLCTDGKCVAYWSTHALEPYGLHAPEQFTATAKDGSTLYATLLLPAGATGAASVPLIVNPYGGPGGMTVANKWGDALLFDELLAEHGFAVLHADNRGTGMRGRDFAQAAYRNFGPVQLEDQLAVIDAALAKYPQLDSKRLGWWGWSWGGTFTLYSMTHSDRFRAGVSVAPVTDWRDYDSVYTERYMGLPAEQADNYRDFSVVNSAAKLHGRLLLVHGTGDDNVHMENSIQFIQKLIEAQKPYDLQLYPRKTHSIAGPDVRTHLYTRILTHFEQYLLPAAQ